MRRVIAEPDWMNARVDGRTEYVAWVEDQAREGRIQRNIEVVLDELTDPPQVITVYEVTGA